MEAAYLIIIVSPRTLSPGAPAAIGRSRHLITSIVRVMVATMNDTLKKGDSFMVQNSELVDRVSRVGETWPGDAP
jgi:hypothetical protein